jgi:hypothetical protein
VRKQHNRAAAQQVTQAEGPHGHAKHALDDVVDHVRVRAEIHKQAGGHGVGEKDAVDRKAGAVAHHHGRLLDLETQL